MSTRERMRPLQPRGSRPKAVYSGEFELTSDLEPRALPATAMGTPYDEARLLVRIAGEPVGFVDVPLTAQELSRAEVLAVIHRELLASIRVELTRQTRLDPEARLDPQEHSMSGAAQEPCRLCGIDRRTTVSVVVCTRNRAHALSACLRSLTCLEHDVLDFIVVDNAPSDDSTREVVQAFADADPRFQYVREELPGLSYARNRGASQATSELIAFTDDDVRVDRLWIKGLLRGFQRRADVGCVTGLVASASLELPVEQYFDGRVGWSSSCEAKVYDSRAGRGEAALYPYAAGMFGTGANFAVRSELLREIGGFDECLGAGSPCEGGEDFDIFVRFIRAGYVIAYEPAALVWHEHRAGRDDLRRQMYAYGKSLSAYLFKYASSPNTMLDILRGVPQGLRHLCVLAGRSGRMGTRTGLAYEPVVAEMRGLAVGPLAYVRARRAQDPIRRREVAP